MKLRILVVAVGALLWVVGSVMLCEGTIRVGRREPGEWTGREPKRDVEIRASDGVALRGWWIRPVQRSGRCVVVLHGIADSRRGGAGFAGMFLDRGDAVLAPDSRGHGASGGSLVTYGLRERDDVVRWVGWLRGQGCERIYGLGESLGGAVLIEAAAVKGTFRAIVAECPYSSLESVARYRVAQRVPLPFPLDSWAAVGLVRGAMGYAGWRYGVALGDGSPAEAMARMEIPVLLIHGTADKETSPAESERLARMGRHTVLWRVEGAGHVGARAVAPVEFERRVREWLR